MEDILGTVQLQIPLRRGTQNGLASLEGALETQLNAAGEPTRRLWAASLAWIDSDSILQVHVGVLVSSAGEHLVVRWIEEVIAGVELPIVFRNSSAVREISSPERVNRPKLTVDRYMWDWQHWASLPAWEPEVPLPSKLHKLRTQPEEASRRLLQLQLAYMYSLRRYLDFARADTVEMYRIYANIFYAPVSVGSVTWETARD